MQDVKNSITLLIIIGDSHTGKSSINDKLCDIYPSLFMPSVSHTSRDKRIREVEGVDYYFVDKNYFTDNNDTFLEWEEFGEEYYGTGLVNIKEAYRQNKILGLVLEERGALSLKKNLQELVIDGENIKIESKIVFLDIEREKICRLHSEKLNEQNLSPTIKREKELVFRSRLEREDYSKRTKELREDIYENSSLVREDFLDERYFSDIISILPTCVEDHVNNLIDEKAKIELNYSNAHEELCKKLSILIPSRKKISYALNKKIAPAYIIDDIAKEFSIETKALIEYSKQKEEFPLLQISGNGIDSARCRFSDIGLVGEYISNFIEENEGSKDNDILNLVVGIHTENGYSSVQLSELANFSLSDLPLSQEIKNKIEKTEAKEKIITKIPKINLDFLKQL